MIDFFKLTNFNRPIHELEEMLLALIAAAGHNGPASSRAVNRFLVDIRSTISNKKLSPFNCIKQLGINRLSQKMRENGIGCYTMAKKGGTFWNLANSDINLKECTREELCAFKGIGMKTASCFVLHSRPNQNMASLDRHILKILREKGCKNAPSQTPGNFKAYYEWEKVVLKELVPSNMTPAEFDLSSWIKQRSRK